MTQNSPPLSRRRLIAAGALGAAAASVIGAPAVANGARTLALVTSFPDSLPGLNDHARRIARRVGALTDDRLRIEVFPAGARVGPFEILDGIVEGKAEMGFATSYYWTKQSQGFNFFATVPFGMMPNEHAAWLEHGGGQALWEKLHARHGIKPLSAGNTGVQMGGWFVKELLSLADLKGLKIRYPGLGGEILRNFGAEPTLLPASELIAAIRDGRLDGLEWIAPWNDLSLGVAAYCKNYYYPGFHEPGHTLELSVSLKVWSALSGAERAAIETAVAAEAGTLYARFDAENAGAIDTLAKDHGVTFRRFPNDIVRAARRAAPEAIRNAVAGDALATEIHDSYMAFLKQQLRWAEYADRAYWQARFI